MSGSLKYCWRVANNYLAGITFGDWVRLLKQNRFAEDPAYWHRAKFITGVAVRYWIFPPKWPI